MAKHPFRVTLLLLALLSTVAIQPLSAQTATAQWRGPEIATLALWADDLWLALTDRDGSYFGRLDERGTFQRFNPLMDTEYQLDLVTALFTPGEDARWATTARGLRAAGGSINHPFILNFIDWRERIAIGGPVQLVARYARQRSLTAQRDYSQLGVEWSPGSDNRSRLSATIGAHFFKPSADVEIGASRNWGTRDRGLELKIGAAVLDAFNNLIFNALGVRPEETPAHFSYRTIPLAGRVAVVGRSPRGRLELHAGLSNRSNVAVTFPQSGDLPYDLEESFRFAGALATFAPTPGIALALYGSVAQAEARRRRPETPSPYLEVREEIRALGTLGSLSDPDGFRLEVDLRSLWRPERRVFGTDSLLDHQDRELFLQLAVSRWPRVGWIWRLAYAYLDREAGSLAPWLTATNLRQVVESGYRFPSGFEIVAGLRWDLDRLATAPFDGGHLRFATSW